jgi:hypothetical protein
MYFFDEYIKPSEEHMEVLFECPLQRCSGQIDFQITLRTHECIAAIFNTNLDVINRITIPASSVAFSAFWTLSTSARRWH